MNGAAVTNMLDASPTLEYAVVDVFVAEPPQPFQGNPLAVVLGGDALSTEQCQALAVEFHLSETVFPMAPTVAGADYRSRIFTIASELPFAGHPSVGGAWVLARLGTIAAGRAVQECGVGLLSLEVPADASEPLTLTGPVPSVSGPVDAGPLLAAVGLGPDDLAGVPRLSGTGIAFAYLPVRAEALARVQADLDVLGGLAEITGVFVFALAAGEGGRLSVRARMLAADIGGEDPATGSAAIALAGWLVASDQVARDGETQYEISQGVEMGRPSQLLCDVTTRAGEIERVRVSGRVALVASGRIRVP